MNLNYKKLHPDAKEPKYKTKGAAGMDVSTIDSCLLGTHDLTIVGTGLSFEIPEGYELQVRSRSGLAAKGVLVVNSPGTIDSDYRGEVKIILGYIGKGTYIINRGDRVAQLILAPVLKASLSEKACLSETKRGSGGFGSTGVN